MTLSAGELADIKARNPCDQVAAQWVTLKRRGRKLMGPCPICSSDPTKASQTRFEVWDDGWVCAACPNGGDVIKLVSLVEGLDFRATVDRLGGGGAVDPEVLRRRQAELEAKNKKREEDSKVFRERERGTLYDIWTRAVKDIAGTPVEFYLARRGLVAPMGCALRYVPDMPYYHGEEPDAPRKRQRVVHRGPAMVAPIVRDGHFSGLHFTYLDLARPKGKAVILDPDNGDELPARKVRGSKAGGKIELVRIEQPRVEIIGEGIETVLSVWRALSGIGRHMPVTAFSAGVDLGNIGGRAAAMITHPELVDGKGRPRRVAGPDPDFSSPAIAVADCVEEVVLLGDGDSERVLTECALYRAQQRLARPGRVVRVAWAPAGRDFNDALMGGAA